MHRHRHRAATRVGEQAVVDLQQALLAVAVVAERGQRAGGTFEVTRRQVVQHQAARAQVARGKLFLDPVLAREQPVHRGVQIVFVAPGHAAVLGQRRGVPPARGGQLRVGREDARGDHRQHQVAFARGLGGDQGRDAQTLHRQRHGLHVAVRTRRGDFEGLRDRRPCLAAQDGTNGENLLVSERGEIGERPLVHARAFAIGLAQQIRGARAPIRDDVDVHGYILHHCTDKSTILHGYNMPSVSHR